jgi:acyl dehydratase
VDPDNNNQPCANISSSKAIGTYSFDASSLLFSYNFTFGNNGPDYDNFQLLNSGAITAVHFHGPAPAGQTAGVQLTVSGPSGSSFLNAGQAAGLKAGLWYLNIHSDACPNGEIRAQLQYTAGAGTTATTTPAPVLVAAAAPGRTAPVGFSGDASQTVDPDNNNQPCAIVSSSKTIGTYTFDASSLLFSYNFTFGDNGPDYDNFQLFNSGAITAVHFHGPAPAGQTASVQITVTKPLGSAILTAEQAAGLKAGLWYLNIHSNACPNGEVRAQLQYSATPAPGLAAAATPASKEVSVPLFGDASQTVDPDNNNLPCAIVSSSKIGGTYAFNAGSGLFSYNITFGDNAPNYDNFQLVNSGTITAVHFHGPAPAGQTAEVQVTVSSPSGSVILNTQQMIEMKAGLWYLNVHSNACPNGELRGQLKGIGLASGVLSVQSPIQSLATPPPTYPINVGAPPPIIPSSVTYPASVGAPPPIIASSLTPPAATPKRAGKGRLGQRRGASRKGSSS